MPQLDRYFERRVPSGRVGQQEVNPEALTGAGDSGEGLVWRGVEAASGSVAGMADVFARVQDMEDEIAVSTARRQAGEHMANLWNDIQNEPDWTKHQALYDKAYSTASRFSPKNKSANAARSYQSFLDQMKPHWDAQFFANQTRRRAQTIDSDTQANIAMASERGLKAIEQGDWSGETLAGWEIDAMLKTRVENGLSTEAQADAVRFQLKQKSDVARVWGGAIGTMELTGIAEAEKMIRESDLVEREKLSLISAARYRFNSMQGQYLQEERAGQEADRQTIFAGIQDQKWDLLPDAIRQSRLSADEKYSWLTRFEQRAEAVASGKKDPFNLTDDELYIKLWRAVNAGDESVTESSLSSYLGKGVEGGISNADYEKLVGMLQKKPAATVNTQIVDSYLDQLTAMKDEFKEWAQADLSNVPFYKGEGVTTGPVLQGDARRAFIRWNEANPKAGPDDIAGAFDALLQSAQKRNIPIFLDQIRAAETALSDVRARQRQTAMLPLTVETTPAPKTRAEFIDTLRRMTDRTEFDKFYDKYGELWQPKQK